MAKTTKQEERLIFTTEKVEEIRKKEEDGYKITRFEKFWYANFPQVRRANLNFALTDDETLEYTKCMLGVDIHGLPFIDPETQVLKLSGVQYFSETFCKIKTEMGEVKNMRLRDYQLDILDMFTDNRFSLLCSSRQSGKCYIYSTFVTLGNKNVPIYQLWYESIVNPTIIQRIKYGIYYLLHRYIN